MDDNAWLKAALPWLYMGGAGVLGRLMYHAKLVKLGKRKPLSWVLLLDIPVALGTGWAAFGIATQVGWVWEAQVSAAIVASYFGPYGMDVLFSKYTNSKSEEHDAD